MESTSLQRQRQDLTCGLWTSSKSGTSTMCWWATCMSSTQRLFSWRTPTLGARSCSPQLSRSLVSTSWKNSCSPTENATRKWTRSAKVKRRCQARSSSPWTSSRSCFQAWIFGSLFTLSKMWTSSWMAAFSSVSTRFGKKKASSVSSR